MTQASRSPNLQAQTQPVSTDETIAEPENKHSAVTLWLFGLTAMTLVFASMLLLALLARSGIGDTSVTAAVNAYTVLTASIGLLALGYVFTMSRRAGLFSASDDSPQTAKPVAAPEGLHIAPTLPPPAKRRASQEEMAQARETRQRRARAISAAASKAEAANPTTPARPTPVVVQVRPTMSQAARPQHRQTRAPRKQSGSAGAGLAALRVPSRPSGSAPAFLRMPPPSQLPRVHPAGFQVRAASVRAASVRAPLRDQPQRPTLSDRFFGRGAHRAYAASGAPSPAMPPLPQVPQPAGWR